MQGQNKKEIPGSFLDEQLPEDSLPLKTICREKLGQYAKTYEYQCQIRRFMRGNHLCAFIADGSILPRENDTSAPMKEAVPFVSPEETALWIPLADGRTIRGMGIREDITLLTALVSGSQLNTLACVMEHLLTDKNADEAELLEKAEICTLRILQEQDTASLIPEAAQRFYEDIRPLDAFCCVNRMRGLHFIEHS